MEQLKEKNVREHAPRRLCNDQKPIWFGPSVQRPKSVRATRRVDERWCKPITALVAIILEYLRWEAEHNNRK